MARSVDVLAASPLLFLLLLERADVVHHVPDVFILGTIAFRGHVVALAIPGGVEEFAVGAVFQRVRIGEIGDVLIVRRHVALAVAVFSMTHRAVVAIHRLALGERLLAGLHRIYLGRIFGGNLAFGAARFAGGLFLLRP